jgi:hypothetical protein
MYEVLAKSKHAVISMLFLGTVNSFAQISSDILAEV